MRLLSKCELMQLLMSLLLFLTLSLLPEAEAKIFSCAELTASGSSLTYDYVVVGAGAAGSPIAARLAEKGYRVLVVEAGGPDQPIESQVPALHAKASEKMPIALDYGVIHYANPADAMLDSKYNARLGGVLYPRGEGIGGSALVNAGITVLPHKGDFDQLGQILGDPYFSDATMWRIWQTKIENCQHRPVLRALHRAGQFLRWRAIQNMGGHGFDGWLKVSQPRPSVIANILWNDPQLRNILLNAEKFNRPSVGSAWHYLRRLASGFDPNDKRSIERREAGLVITPLAVDEDGRRNGVRNLILSTEAKFPDTLHIATNALADKIIFDSEMRATGLQVIFQKAGLGAEDEPHGPRLGSVVINIEKDIVIAAGAIESSALVMRSGIGPRKELEKHGIPVLIDNPEVGRHIHDRYEVGVISELNDPIATLNGATFSASPEDPFFRAWQKNGSGLYGTNGSLIAFTARSHPSLPQPNLYIFGLPAGFRGYEEDYSTSITKDPKAFTWAVLVAKTENRAGFVVLSSADPSSQPVVDFQYFQEGAGKDEQALNAGVKIVRTLNAQMAGRPVRRELSPGPAIRTDAEVNGWTRAEAWGHHVTSGLRFGPVVDNRFRLRGTSNVRVGDASLWPDIPGFFLASSVFIMAEMGAERILEDADAENR